jgi:PKD repeat protein
MLAANTWTHLATTYDGATLRLYVNGVQVSSVAQTGNILTSTNPLEIGGDSIYGQFFRGTIDEVRVYNRALSPSQIRDDMNASVGTPTAVASATPTSGLAPLTVAFSSAGSSDPESAALSYAWTFGDGTPSSTAANPTHTYQTAGVYAAQLTVSDGVNPATSSVVRITVETPGEPPPSVRFSDVRYVVAENSGTATINVWLSKPHYLEVFTDFAAAGGTATPGVDYVTNSGTLRFLPGETNQSFFVTLLDTSSQNPAERTVHLTLSHFVGATAGDPVACDLVILDDDSPPRFVSPRLSSEGLFQTTLSGVPGQRFAIEFSPTLAQWTGLTSLTNVTGIMDFTDVTSPGAARRFYRTVAGYRGVFTHHNDNFRTGQNLSETILTTSNVTAAFFGKLFSYPLDGMTFSSPLYVANVSIPGKGFRNVVYVATEHDTVYAFDADGLAGTALWQVSFINPAAGVTTVPAVDTGEIVDIPNEIGITGTPVIDPASGTLYVVAKTKEVIGGATDYVQRLHALDLATGAEKFGGPVAIQASVPGTGAGSDNGQLPFDSLRENQRPALLLSQGVVYIAFASHGDQQPYHGWVLGYNATTLQQVMAFNVTPDGEGGGIWQGGGGLAADAAGNIYFISGDGTFDADSGGRNYGDSFVKISPSGAVLDYFTPYDQADLDAANMDLGSANPLVLPDQAGIHPHLVTSASKNGTLYLIDRDNMGHFNPVDDSQIVQSILLLHENYISPVYFNGTVYYSVVDGEIRAYQLSNGLLSATPASQSSDTYAFPGGTLAISAHGTSDGILWAVQRRGTALPGVLHAYDATNLAIELYNSNQAGSRDTLDIATKYSVPLVVNGKVFVGSVSRLTVYGLLP